MDAGTSDRQARLKPDRAELHPSLPAAMWTSAVHMAELVAAWRGALGSSETAAGSRPLSDDDFDFRGGIERQGGHPFRRGRAGEPQVPDQ